MHSDIIRLLATILANVAVFHSVASGYSWSTNFTNSVQLSRFCYFDFSFGTLSKIWSSTKSGYNLKPYFFYLQKRSSFWHLPYFDVYDIPVGYSFDEIEQLG